MYVAQQLAQGKAVQELAQERKVAALEAQAAEQLQAARQLLHEHRAAMEQRSACHLAQKQQAEGRLAYDRVRPQILLKERHADQRLSKKLEAAQQFTVGTGAAGSSPGSC